MGKEQNSVSRRDFFKKSATLGAGAVAVGALGACTNQATADSGGGSAGSWADTITWDQEVELVIIGCGGAGITAAMEAMTAGISFVVLEKDEVWRGGNTGCTGNFVVGETKEGCFTYTQSMCWGSTPDDVIQSHVDAVWDLVPWFESFGWSQNFETNQQVVYTQIPGYDEFQGEHFAYTLPTPGDPVNTTWGMFRDKAVEMGISPDDGNVLLSTPAIKLHQDPTTKEVIGVKAMTGVTIEKPSYDWTGGTEINIKATRAVILACGGYENGADYIHNLAPHIHGATITFYGTPYNKGDGLRMAQEIGAKLWHMNKKECHAYSNGPLSREIGVGVVMLGAYGPKRKELSSSIFVNRFGKRYQNESHFSGHTDRTKRYDEFRHWFGKDDVEPEDYSDYPNNPFFWVFDQTLVDRGSFFQVSRFAGMNELCTWSEDSAAEVDKGYLLKADTIEELAAQIVVKDYFGRVVGIDPASLAQTIQSWNDSCTAGTDPEFGRDPETMAPINNGPFYAMELIECQTNTQGGPERNKDCQTIDVNGEPIPRLYSCGELGSIYGHLYNGGGNIPEAYCTGRMAVFHALTLDLLA